MKIADLEMENTALRIECKNLMDENKNLKTALIVSDYLRNQDIAKTVVKTVVKLYYQGKDIDAEIEKVKEKLEQQGRLKVMAREFKKPSKEQLDAEEIFKKEA